MAGTVWAGIALRRMRAQADPDAPARAMALPAAWEDEAAAALAALAPGQGAVSLPALADGWISRLVAQGLRLRLLWEEEGNALAGALHRLVLTRRGAPGAATWRGEAKAEPRFVLNLPAFLDDAGGFDIPGYMAAVGTAVRALDVLTAGKAHALRLGFADLAGLLAAMGLAYDSTPAREAAACLTALTRAAAEEASAELAQRHGARESACLFWPAPPAGCAMPGLAVAARQALERASRSGGLRHAALLALTPPDAAEGLLGIETGGLAPAQGPTRFAHAAHGGVEEQPTRAARRAMALHGAGAAALLAPVPAAARAAMEASVRPYLHAPAPAAPAQPQPAHPLPPPRPAFGPAQVWRVTLAGHRVTLTATEAYDGSLAAIGLAMARDGAAFRGLMDSFVHVVNLGLARGMPLSDYVQAVAYGQGGPCGTVEGDPEIRRATSVLDWAFRRLAIAYLGGAEARHLWPDPSEEDCAAEAAPAPAPRADAPQLPLDLPLRPSPAARRGRLRLVG
ncbi:hypothetical protein [Roseomonas marmotae]|uniref:Ribonucleotide reductase large subunit C-terminal domain-containing protein n=1 Tax=Roseomonas marmotae TaxID=2768161 RepID=A0ABS3KG16_9PROT|nr:hypothetical protein [Roseomonas marmotae]MBO1076419.1 hypothetical protein [Roseomonas marmotae]QTI79378.1 hypothetical protein IAI58_00645 [Roseomonas marmotae]